MSEHTPVMHVQENRRSGQRGDVWTVSIEGGDNDGDPGSVESVTVDSWAHAQELAAAGVKAIRAKRYGEARDLFHRIVEARPGQA